MHLSIPDPDKGDTIKTALTIGKSYDENLATKITKVYEELGITYASLRNYGLSNDHPYKNAKCIIRKGVLLSKSGGRGIRKQPK